MMAARPLTARQEKVYRFLRDYIAARGYSPTVREIVFAFGWCGPNAARGHLSLMKQKGWITWEPGLARTIRILAAPEVIPH